MPKTAKFLESWIHNDIWFFLDNWYHKCQIRHKNKGVIGYGFEQIKHFYAGSEPNIGIKPQVSRAKSSLHITRVSVKLMKTFVTRQTEQK